MPNDSKELKNQEITISRDSVSSLMRTVRELYLADDIPWVIGYSGGKDSTATV